MKTTLYNLTVVSAKRRKTSKVIPPTEMPSDLVPGEFVMIPDPKGKQEWYVFCDKQRWWGNGRWNVTGTISSIPTGMPEADMYELRRSLLERFGWIR
jgi:hypothetical protein